jgi:hypothetical protein
MSDSDFYVKIMTNEVQHVKNMFAIIKDIPEINLKFTEQGITVHQQSLTQSSSIYIDLPAQNFMKYHCSRPTKIGLEVNNLNNILKSPGQSKDILTIFVKKLQASDVQIPFGFVFTNSEKHEETVYTIDNLDGPEDEEQRPLDHQYYITMNSGDFKDTIEKLKGLKSEVCRITYSFDDDTLSFYTQGSSGTCNIVRSKIETISAAANTRSNNVIIIYCRLQKLVEYIKCVSLSNTVVIGMGKNNDKLTVEYNVGSLGRMILSLGIENKPDNWN